MYTQLYTNEQMHRTHPKVALTVITGPAVLRTTHAIIIIPVSPSPTQPF